MCTRLLIPLICFFIGSNEGFSQFTAPYFTSFETEEETEGWTHYAEEGEDSWILGSHPVEPYSSSFGENAFITGDGNIAPNSRMYLESPGFELPSDLNGFKVTFHRYSDGNSSDLSYQMQYTLNDTDWFPFSHFNSVNWLQGSSFPIGDTAYVFSSCRLAMNYESFIRFRIEVETGDDPGSGCAIDRFELDFLFLDLKEFQSVQDTAFGVLPSQEELNLELYYLTQYEWVQPQTDIKTYIYYSEDDVFDENDLFLDSADFDMSPFGGHEYWILELDTFIQGGYNHLFYVLDPLNEYTENNEDNNLCHKVFYVKPTFSVPYSTSFEEEEDKVWLTSRTYDLSSTAQFDIGRYKKYAEYINSGNQAYFAQRLQTPDPAYIESLSFDLSETDDNCLCLLSLARNFSTNNFQLRFYAYPGIDAPFSNDFVNIGYMGTGLRWKSNCVDLSEYNGESDFKFLLRNSSGSREFLIDDVYVGPKKPNALIEAPRHLRFTSIESSTDTLSFQLMNSGMLMLPGSNLDFFWSADSLLDDSDVQLGSMTLPSLEAQSTMELEFGYEKIENSEDEFYLIYKIDAENEIDEMHEFDNLGFFKICAAQERSLPYFNDFETEIVGWETRRGSGESNWVWAEPQGDVISQAYSGSKAFITVDTGSVSPFSRMYLMSPIFDLSNVDKPVVEFDIEFDPAQSWFALTPSHLMMSNDGGHTWNLVNTEGINYKGFFHRMDWNYANGNDITVDATNFSGDPTPYMLENGFSRVFSSQSIVNFYQGRFYDDLYHYSMSLEDLDYSGKVRFMMVVYTPFQEPWEPFDENLMGEGILIDNFAVSDGKPDLAHKEESVFSALANDKKLVFSFMLKNEGNSISPNFRVKHFLSTDSVLDENDLDLGGENVNHSVLRPYQSYSYNFDADVDLDLSPYNYLITNIDPDNLIDEINEVNNIVAHPFLVNPSRNFPYTEEFDDLSTSQWNWIREGSGLKDGCIFRDYSVLNETNAFEGGYGADTAGQIGAISFYRSPIFTGSIDPYPTYYLYSPSFDLSDFEMVSISLSLRIYGADERGVNFEYSTDGGLEWNVLGDYENAENAMNPWYVSESLAALNDAPGWEWFLEEEPISGIFPELANQENVRFRMQVRGEVNMYLYSFSLFELFIDPNTIFACPGEEVEIGDIVTSTPGLYYDTLQTILGEDSIVQYSFNNYDTYLLEETVDICQGETVLFPDGTEIENIQEDISYLSSFQTIQGCDSLIETNVSLSLADTDGDGICDIYEIVGCMNPAALNYNPEATDPGICSIGADSPPFTLTSEIVEYIPGLGKPVFEEENSDSWSFEVFPNPSAPSNNIQLFISSPRDESAIIRIFDSSGKLIHSSLLDADSANTYYLVETDNVLSQGIYHISISSSQGVKSRKFLIQQ